MTPEAKRFPEKADDHLKRGSAMLAGGLDEDAGRAAYLAVFLASQALIFEQTGRVLKTHKGVHAAQLLRHVCYSEIVVCAYPTHSSASVTTSQE